MRLLAFILSVLLLLSSPLLAVTKRALLIGINEYEPRKGEEIAENGRVWINLDGTVNDAMGIKDAIQSRYGFEAENIRMLISKDETTRASILSHFDQLLQQSEKGDIVFIYYAGHGSQIRNSLSPEPDKRDETIVPSDAYNGSPDIRDKELNQIFNQFIKKGVKLTVIFDSCNSGSGTRSDLNLSSPKVRMVSPLLDIDLRDPYSEVDIHDLAGEGALFISSAQDYQLAKEYTDSKGNKHGAFTFCLLRALRNSSPEESAFNIFKKAKSIMLYNDVPKQNPTIEGNEQRKSNPIFGEVNRPAMRNLEVIVFKKDGKDDIYLDGGYANGIRVGAELVMLNKDGSRGEVRIKVTKMPSVNRSIAKVIQGSDGDIKIGNFFRLDGWSEENSPNLQLWYPTRDFSKDELLSLYQRVKRACKDIDVEFVQDPKAETTTHVLVYTNDSWKLRGFCGKIIELPDNFTESEFKNQWKLLSEQEKECADEKPGLFIFLPPESDLKQLLTRSLTMEASTIELLSSPKGANYLLAGKADDNGKLYYSWVQTESSPDSPFPPRTSWVQQLGDTDITFANLYAEAERLSRISAWLTLESPPNVASFPYKLALKNADTGEIVEDGGAVQDGDIYGFVLQKDRILFHEWNRRHRFLYVFGIDNDGNMKLFYPRYTSIENNTKTLVYQNRSFLDEIQLGPVKTFQVSPPFGIDTYILLSSAEPIDDPQILEDYRQMRTVSTDNPLLKLFKNNLIGTRGASDEVTTPTNWQLERIQIVSEPSH
ncbi:caspase family protein [Limibacter armeniacum]|uniref:caspase family protein n=1 Tax=Limibacter armeniacum TaxID=466084 RepID=UPI002FE67D41